MNRVSVASESSALFGRQIRVRRGLLAAQHELVRSISGDPPICVTNQKDLINCLLPYILSLVSFFQFSTLSLLQDPFLEVVLNRTEIVACLEKRFLAERTRFKSIYEV